MSRNGLRGIKTIRDFNLAGRNVFLRLDLNVPMEGTKITDDNRIREALPTIQYALEHKARLILCSHLGRPESREDKQFSLEPVGKRLSELLKMEVLLVEDNDVDAVKPLLVGLKSDQLLLLENIRFERGETKNSPELAEKLAAFTDVYVNDAFGASHRAHASIDGLPRLIKEKGIGLLIEKEIQMFDQLFENPARPFYAIMGGSKVSDKIGVIEKLIDVADGFIVGGAMAYTFLKAKGLPVGKSRVETEKLNYSRELIARLDARQKKFFLPVDHVTAAEFNGPPAHRNVEVIPEGELALDIGLKTQKLFSTAIAEARTIFWNGPMGVFENKDYSQGTFAIARAIAENGNAIKIVGGGDSALAAQESGVAKQMTHISTGGGASLEYLQGDPLPGLEVCDPAWGEVFKMILLT